ncbi:acylase [Pseudoalteromonas sp. G4]|uniref:acylase n=1 Tax=Pseudoalteromonas sp. G4 TaxID=2992761 RepID=UPI00237E7B91|nr:acylase [Pseudoalteromonas sp. G4]MDE3272393.1 acylase [Pseudoalteromonas sp. G4]
MKLKLALIASSILGLTACGVDYEVEPITPEPEQPSVLHAFDPDGTLSASIRWTDYGVPHITADNLQSLAFGSGYAYAKDNMCILADQIVKVSSERSKYFGPDKVPGSGDSANIISDFGHKALRVMEQATARYDEMSERSRALVEGYVAGYNKYLAETPVAERDPHCGAAPWLKPIEKEQLVAYMFSTSQLASGLRFLDTSFYANPAMGDEYLPRFPRLEGSEKPFSMSFQASAPDLDLGDLGSNAWAIGKDASDNGKGILLANPHFPFTGHLRFWQSHLTIPGHMDVMGAGLQGMPGIVNIGFNQHLGWTHTVSKSRRFVTYRLDLAENNPMQYVVDGETKDISKQTYLVEVMIAPGSTMYLAKDYYYSHHGLMIETPPTIPLFPWDDKHAFTLKDASEFNMDLIDHWLALNLATNLDEFQQAFKDYNGIPWVNTMYADNAGNAFYIDKSNVLNLNDTALSIMRTEPTLVATRNMLGFDVLPGNTALFEANGLNSYEQAPKLLRSDYIQNSNDSYWATNPAEPLSGYSILYGDDLSPLSLRTRMSLKMLTDSRGEDALFNAAEVESALFSNRSYLHELVGNELIAQCEANGANPIAVTDSVSVDVSKACTILKNWDGRFNLTSKGGQILREFAYNFNAKAQLTVPFDVADPANTPSSLITDGSALWSLAKAVADLQKANIALDAPLSEIQFAEKTLANGLGSGVIYPWAGAKHVEGGFNIFSSAESDDTLYAIHQYPRAKSVTTDSTLASGLANDVGYHVNYGSSWMFVVNFKDDGPEARGLLSYSQSSNDNSAHMDDQTKHYSETTRLRPILFKESDIATSTIESMEISQ